MNNLPNDLLSSTSYSDASIPLAARLQLPTDSSASSTSLPSLSTEAHSETDYYSVLVADDPDIVDTTLDESTAAAQEPEEDPESIPAQQQQHPASGNNTESESEQIGQQLLKTSFSPARSSTEIGGKSYSSQTSPSSSSKAQSTSPPGLASMMATRITSSLASSRRSARANVSASTSSSSSRRGNTISALINAQEQHQQTASGSSSATNLNSGTTATSNVSTPIRKRASARMSSRVASDTTGGASTSNQLHLPSTSVEERPSTSRPESPPQIVILDNDSPTQSQLIDLTKDTDDCLIISHRQGNKRRMMPPNLGMCLQTLFFNLHRLILRYLATCGGNKNTPVSKNHFTRILSLCAK
jgi:hypothetical protein